MGLKETLDNCYSSLKNDKGLNSVKMGDDLDFIDL